MTLSSFKREANKREAKRRRKHECVIEGGATGMSLPFNRALNEHIFNPQVEYKSEHPAVGLSITARLLSST